jgi:hypothetical protein
MRAPMLRCGAYFMQEECSVKEKPASTEQDGASERADRTKAIQPGF